MYTYSNGNMTALKVGGRTLATYAYGENNGPLLTQTYANGAAVSFTYDNLGRTKTAAYSDGRVLTYVYNGEGNLLTANGHVYTYGNAEWKDLLTAFDGETLTYDASGNPTSYYNGTRWAMTWANGRSLTRAESYAGTVDFAYDLNGLRRSKTVGNVEHNYLYAGGKLLRETYGTNTLDFFYDASGMPYALKHNGTVYYYITNLQGDVMLLVDADGNTVASYEYDPYGKVISATGTLAEVNPIRYRGYYYDSETGFYYLQSRYYDPTTCRFINADTLASTGQGVLGYNMFAYCGNNPVNYSDVNGYAGMYNGAPQYGWAEVAWNSGQWLSQETDKEEEMISSGEVSYTSKGAGKGARIDNSYQIMLPWVMFEFVEDNRGSDIVGSTFGVVYEWGFHNIAYIVGDAFGMDSITDPARDLDVGKTIHDDKREWLTAKWIMSEGMKASYFMFFPVFYIFDGLSAEWWDIQNGN